jgi:hypothetical protein
MTIAVAIRTGSTVIFAADSKVTTQGLAGFDANGTPQWVPQTFDNASKVVYGAQKSFMAMIAGNATIGEMSATDVLLQDYLSPIHPHQQAQDAAVATFINRLVQRKQAFWGTTAVPPAQWPGPIILLACPGWDRIRPRVWRIDLGGPGSNIVEILQLPSMYLEGAYQDAFGLTYGYRPDVLEGIATQSGANLQSVATATSSPQGFLRPVDRINFAAMPTQDAVEMAVFLCEVQIQMDRFLPGTPACGGPIDVMVLVMAPNPDILSYPGKMLHHPRAPQG